MAEKDKKSQLHSTTVDVPAADWMSDIHLLIGSLPNVILPVLGFVGTIVMIRYPNEYKRCVMKEHKLEEKDYGA